MRIFIALLLAAASASVTVGQNYCSLSVRVLSPDGRRPAVAVSVVEASGRTEDKDQDLSNDVQFCDLGGLPVTVKIGDEGTCNQVIVREVPVAWNKPYLLHVTYDPESCEERPPLPIPNCRVIFRVSSGERWEVGARILIKQPTQGTLISDRFGRASSVINLGDQIEGSVVAGADTRMFSFRCTRDEPVHETRIDLQSKH